MCLLVQRVMDLDIEEGVRSRQRNEKCLPKCSSSETGIADADLAPSTPDSYLRLHSVSISFRYRPAPVTAR